MAWVHRLCWTMISLLVAFQLLALFLYWTDQHYLAGLENSISNPAVSPSEQAHRISQFLRNKPSETNSHYFLIPTLGFLRATPRQVAEYGGDCADRSRLLVVLLDLRGIRASKWALYSSDAQPRHAVVELDAETGKMVMDGLFGLSFPRPAGGYYGIEDLRGHPEILRSRIRDLVAHGEQPGADRLEGYPIDLYVYSYARTINWDKSVVMRTFYRVLHRALGAKVDTLYRPAVAEQPALMLVWGLAGPEAGILICWLGATYIRRKKGNRSQIETTMLSSI